MPSPDGPELRWENAVVVAGAERTWAELRDETPPPPAEPYAWVCADPVNAFGALARIAADGTDAAILESARLSDAVEDALLAAGYHVGSALPARRAPERGRVGVVTSGSTGTPKVVPHTLARLATMAATEPRPRRWLFPYSPGTYAWYQLAVLGLTVPEQTLVPVDARSLDWVDAAADARVDAVSATPSFWRRSLLLAGDRLRALPLAQLTLGGEPVDQRLLDVLAELYPRARLTHVYASSEAGAAVVVSDGRAGFPAAWLGRPLPNGAELRVVEGELLVRSPWAATDDWIASGDAAELRDDRVVVTGRLDGSTINVGGSKVAAREVESVLLDHPDVVWCRVFARRSPLVGELVAAEVCLRDPDAAGENELKAWCRDRLPEFAVPRLVEALADVPISESAKSGA